MRGGSLVDYSQERKSRAHYERRARLYDWANRLAALLRGTSGTRERRKAVRRLELKPGDRILEVSVGTGTNVPLIWESMGEEITIIGLDISPNMLAQCKRKLSGRGIRAELVVGEGAQLPFASERFDAVFHHGGLAEFGDRAGAIGEMWRVARPGARLVICDAGRPTDGRLSLTNRVLMKFQPEYDQPPPTELLPPDAADTKLSWFHGGGWYLIETRKPATSSGSSGDA